MSIGVEQNRRERDGRAGEWTEEVEGGKRTRELHSFNGDIVWNTACFVGAPLLRIRFCVGSRRNCNRRTTRIDALVGCRVSRVLRGFSILIIRRTKVGLHELRNFV